MKLLDLFCGAGGAAMGYFRAGFTQIVGVDLRHMPRYPFTFVQGDALEYAREHGAEFDAIHASPPCQKHIKGLGRVNTLLGRVSRHSDHVSETRDLLSGLGIPYVIENVIGAPLKNAIQLCGSSFGLAVRRHRLFEASVVLLGVDCRHERQDVPRFWTSWRPNGEKRLARVVQVYGNAGDRSHWNRAMGIDWMTWQEQTQAIPPAYTEYLGRQLLAHIDRQFSDATYSVSFTREGGV